SGEIYLENGLEDALNIDRHGFNEVHPHYMALQHHLHKLLNEVVFPAALRASESSGRRRADASRTTEDESFLVGIRSVLETRYSLSRSSKRTAGASPVKVDCTKRRVAIYDHPLWPKNRIARREAERIVVAFMLARQHAEGSDQVDELAFRIL